MAEAFNATCFYQTAHICGAAGKRVRRGRINTIIGLDPAGPLFDGTAPINRLDFGDADYVEVIHTDVGTFGIGAAIGHADFYPNGGSNQPSCFSKFNIVLPTIACLIELIFQLPSAVTIWLLTFSSNP